MPGILFLSGQLYLHYSGQQMVLVLEYGTHFIKEGAQIFVS